MSYTCYNCKDWAENIDIINAPFCLNLTVVGEYTGKQFRYCPWCGNALVIVTGAKRIGLKRCGYCSNENKKKETHCQKCGEKFNLSAD